MNRADAEKAARAGAKVRHESWAAHDWIVMRERKHLPGGENVFDQDGYHLESWAWNIADRDGWTIVSPAPTASPDFEARVADLERRFEAHSHRIDVDPFFAGGPTLEYQDPRGEFTPITVRGDSLPPEPTRHLSAESLTGAMGDDGIYAECRAVFDENNGLHSAQVVIDGVTEVAIRLTRASVIAEIEAAREGAAQVYWIMQGGGQGLRAAIDHILKAVRK